MNNNKLRKIILEELRGLPLTRKLRKNFKLVDFLSESSDSNLLSLADGIVITSGFKIGNLAEALKPDGTEYSPEIVALAQRLHAESGDPTSSPGDFLNQAEAEIASSTPTPAAPADEDGPGDTDAYTNPYSAMDTADFHARRLADPTAPPPPAPDPDAPPAADVGSDAATPADSDGGSDRPPEGDLDSDDNVAVDTDSAPPTVTDDSDGAGDPDPVPEPPGDVSTDEDLEQDTLNADVINYIDRISTGESAGSVSETRSRSPRASLVKMLYRE